MGREDYLFSRFDWHLVDQNQRKQMLSDIEGMDPDRLLNTSVEDLATFFSDKYKIVIPNIDHGNVSVEQKETKIDVSHDSSRLIHDRSRPFYIPGTEVEVEVPFSGEADALQIRPTTYDFNPPRARVRDSAIVFSVSGTTLSAEGVRKSIDQTIRSIEGYLGNLTSDVSVLNSQLPGEAHTAIERRRNKLLANRNMVAGLGFKIKERAGVSKTYVAPDVRGKIAPVMPAPSSSPYTPEPTLAPADYEHILGVMQGMTQVMELSPSAFMTSDEETLRSHFLVQLNGHYQGQATGETFNYQGKTDILIRSEGKNIFIAECKFWSGPKNLLETIDQLLRYSSWRDTKTAVVLLNRNRDFSKVLVGIPETVRSHPQFKRDLSGSTETTFRFLFANPEDRNRELHVAVMAFNVPTPRK